MARTEQGRCQLSVCVAVYQHHPPPNLETLAGQVDEALAGLSGELVVAYNGVDPASVRLPRSAVHVAFPLNRGVPVAWNAAVSESSGDVVVVANDDVHLGPGSLRLLWEALRSCPEAGVVGPVGTNWDLQAGRHREYLNLSGLPVGAISECDVVSGFLFATRRDTFDTVGGFDEALSPCSWEEVDYCTAVRVDQGLSCFAVAGVSYEHTFGISARRSWRKVSWDGRTERLRTISHRNRAHFRAKWSAEAGGPPRVWRD
jgi:GT2 family glycosyltransferase